MAKTILYHCCLDVRGTLKNSTKRELGWMFKNARTGKRLTADEAREVLFDHLTQGHEVIPLDPDCEGFDYSGEGCPGHPRTTETAATSACACRTCWPINPAADPASLRMVVCPTCGNKRCPHANDHNNACTGSNAPGQPGSAYP